MRISFDPVAFFGCEIYKRSGIRSRLNLLPRSPILRSSIVLAKAQRIKGEGRVCREERDTWY